MVLFSDIPGSPRNWFPIQAVLPTYFSLDFVLPQFKRELAHDLSRVTGSVNDLMSFSQQCIGPFQSNITISYRQELYGDPVVSLFCHLSCPPHCFRNQACPWKTADLSEARRCVLSNINLSSELNSPACALPFSLHRVWSGDTLLTWSHYTQRLHIKAVLFQKAKICVTVSCLQTVTVTSTIFVSPQNIEPHADRLGASIGAQGIRNGKEKRKP